MFGGGGSLTTASRGMSWSLSNEVVFIRAVLSMMMLKAVTNVQGDELDEDLGGLPKKRKP